MNTETTLATIYESHAAELARIKADYTRELNAKLEQINKQAETIQDERQRLEQEKKWDEYALKKIDDLETQLLSALAAIGKKDEMLLACAKSQEIMATNPINPDEWRKAAELTRQIASIAVDLSLLHEHDK